jgi:hypothetical protein
MIGAVVGYATTSASVQSGIDPSIAAVVGGGAGGYAGLLS